MSDVKKAGPWTQQPTRHRAVIPGPGDVMATAHGVAFELEPMAFSEIRAATQYTSIHFSQLP